MCIRDRFDGDYHRAMFAPDMDSQLGLLHSPTKVKAFLNGDFSYYSGLYIKLRKAYGEDQNTFRACLLYTSLAVSLLVHSQAADGFGLAAPQATLHGALHDGVDFIPAQAELIGDGLLAGGFQPGNGKRFKQGGKAARRFRPGKFHHTHAVDGTLAAGRFGVQDGAELTGVEVAPAALRCV